MPHVRFPKEWHALKREAELCALQLAVGIHALGNAGYAEQGYYTQAFFGLSIGLERLAKLCIIAAHTIEHAGTFPSNDDLRNIGHDLEKLVAKSATIGEVHCLDRPYRDRPNDTIHQGILKTLSEFAKVTRYFNLDYITGTAFTDLPEPTGAWWVRVGVPILDRHYSGRTRARDERNAAIVSDLLRESATVLQHLEDETMVDDIELLSRRTGSNAVVQRYGRLYTMQIVRWLASLVDHLASAACYKQGVLPLLALTETFHLFMNDDKMLLSRKTWSIYRP